MLKIKNFVVLAFLLSVCSTINLHAQSTVYFFVPQTANNECTLKINGVEIGELRGPLKKITGPFEPMKIAYKTYDRCYKKCIIRNEGKVLFATDYKFTNATTLAVSDIPSEIQLNLTEGSIHYVKLTPKGFTNFQFKEISEKEALKLMKKSVALEEYIEE